MADEIRLPQKTLLEMQAGRRALVLHNLVEKSGRIDDVRRILGNVPFSTLLSEDNLVTLKVNTKDGILTKSCTLDDFPSDEMITWLMLIGE